MKKQSRTEARAEAFKLIFQAETNNDDVEFLRKGWGAEIARLFKAYEEYGIIGVAGSAEFDKNAAWWNYKNIYGQVLHRNEGNSWLTTFSPLLTKDLTPEEFNDYYFLKEELKDIIKQRIETEGNECDLNDIDVSKITDMSDLFNNFQSFNGDISKWDVSNVTNMSQMFTGCMSFNQDISDWDVSNVTNMADMFNACMSFNQDISRWNVSKVKYMYGMFCHCERFNQDISRWDVSNVENMRSMFYNCCEFNQPLNNWDVSKIIDMNHMFYYCKKFNQPLNNWNVSNVLDMSYMFYKCEKFNQDISNWDASKLGDPWNVASTMYKFCPIEQKHKPKNTF
mgnify:CR=1 FL=1